MTPLKKPHYGTVNPTGYRYKAYLSNIYILNANPEFQVSGNGDGDDAESEEDDDSYWNQYDQFTATATTPGLEAEPYDQIKEITPRLEDTSSYYNQYDNVETAISSGGGVVRGVMDRVGMANESGSSSGGSGSTENGLLDDIALEDYIRDTVRNLSQLALRSGMSEKRLQELIREGMN